LEPARWAPLSRVLVSLQRQLVQVGHQGSRVDAQSVRKSTDRPDGRVSAPGLATADVGAIEAGETSELLLREATLQANLA